MLLLSCPEKRVCDEGLAGCNTVVTLRFLKVPSPSRGFFSRAAGKLSAALLRLRKTRQRVSGGSGGVGGGLGGAGAPGFFYYRSLGESHSAGVPRPWYTIVKRW